MFIQSKNFGQSAAFNCGNVEGIHDSNNHIHQYLEIEMVTDGEIEIVVSGRRHIARAGDIAVIPPFKVHSFKTPEYVSMLICTLSSFFLPQSVSREELFAERDCFVFHASEPLWSFLCNVNFRHFKTLHSFDSATVHTRQAIIHLILAEFLISTRVIGSQELGAVFPRILLYLSEHFTEDLSEAKVAAAVLCSPKYVSKCFAAIPNLGFRDFINQLRLEEAKWRIYDSDETILSIAMECGFKNESSFYRIFRRSVGMSPAQYRVMSRNRL